MCRWPWGCADYPDGGGHPGDRKNDSCQNASSFPYPAPDHLVAHGLGGDAVRRVAGNGLHQLAQLSFHHTHRASRSSSSASSGSSCRRASACDRVLLTVPTAQPSSCATCTSGRSSKTLSTSTARWRAVSDPSALRTASRAVTSAAMSLGTWLSGTDSVTCSLRQRRRLQVAHRLTITRRT